MSATNRGTDREDLDGYFTPIACARAICKVLLDVQVSEQPYVLEPSVGRGAFAIAAREILNPSLVVGVDLERRPELDAVGLDEFHEQDFLEYDPEYFFDLVVGNPPFNQAEEHVRHALTMIAPQTMRGSGMLAFLLRLNFLEGVERVSGFWKEHPPRFIYVLNRRPSFKKTKKPKVDKKTGQVMLSKRTGKPLMVSSANDATAYGVFIWDSRTSTVPEPRIRWLDWKNEKESVDAG